MDVPEATKAVVVGERERGGAADLLPNGKNSKITE